MEPNRYCIKCKQQNGYQVCKRFKMICILDKRILMKGQMRVYKYLQGWSESYCCLKTGSSVKSIIHHCLSRIVGMFIVGAIRVKGWGEEDVESCCGLKTKSNVKWTIHDCFVTNHWVKSRPPLLFFAVVWIVSVGKAHWPLFLGFCCRENKPTRKKYSIQMIIILQSE